MVNPYVGPTIVGLAAGFCIGGTALTFGLSCLPAGAIAVYTAANGRNNVSKGDGFLDGWNWQDASMAGLAGLLPVADVGVGTMAALGFVLGAGADIVHQQMEHPGKVD